MTLPSTLMNIQLDPATASTAGRGMTRNIACPYDKVLLVVDSEMHMCFCSCNGLQHGLLPEFVAFITTVTAHSDLEGSGCTKPRSIRVVYFIRDLAFIDRHGSAVCNILYDCTLFDTET